MITSKSFFVWIDFGEKAAFREITAIFTKIDCKFLIFLKCPRDSPFHFDDLSSRWISSTAHCGNPEVHAKFEGQGTPGNWNHTVARWTNWTRSDPCCPADYQHSWNIISTVGFHQYFWRSNFLDCRYVLTAFKMGLFPGWRQKLDSNPEPLYRHLILNSSNSVLVSFVISFSEKSKSQWIIRAFARISICSSANGSEVQVTSCCILRLESKFSVLPVFVKGKC